MAARMAVATKAFRRYGMPERTARWLACVMWFECVALAAALVAVCLPTSAMQAIHAEMGLGRMPQAPIVDYLARSLSLVYASMAPLCGFLARDVRRYRDVIAFQAAVKLVAGGGLLALDIAIGMPLFWTVCEGPLIMALSIAVLLMVRELRAGLEAARSARSAHGADGLLS
jgi:hypothetical protein